MPWSMQGDKLLPCGQDVLGCGVRLRAPDRGRGDGPADAAGDLAQAPAAELGGHGLAVRRSAVGDDVDQLALDPGRLGVPELHSCELLEMIVQQPRMVDGGLQDERLAPRNRGAVAAM